MDDKLIYFGAAVKALEDGVVEGQLIVFDSVDLQGQYFDRDTDFDLENWPGKTTVYYTHGLDPTVGRRPLGLARKGDLWRDDTGVWVRQQLDLRDRYERAIYELAKAGKLGMSSGTASHLVEVEQTAKGERIKRWPLGLDASLTPTPVEPGTRVMPIKSLAEALKSAPELPIKNGDSSSDPAPEADPEVPVGTGAAAETAAVQIVSGTKENDVDPNKTQAEQAEQTTPAASPAPTPNGDGRLDSLEQHMKSLGDQVEKLLGLVTAAPAGKSVGYVSETGGQSDQAIKSFGDFLVAVKRNDVTRLKSVYGLKALGDDQNVGVLLPTEYRADLMRIAFEQSPLVARVTRIPVTTHAGEWPALDNFVPTAGSGQTAASGGVTMTKRAPGGEFTETEPEFRMIAYRPESFGAITKIPYEYLADSPVTIEALLRQLFGISIASRTEHLILRGSGVSEPVGVLNSSAAIAIEPDTNGTFAYADASEMVTHFKLLNPGRAIWVAHPGIRHHVNQFQVGSSGNGVFTAILDGRTLEILPPTQYPIHYSEHMPQSQNRGCVALIDAGAYYLFMREDVSVAYSEHAGFDKGLSTWRVTTRMDGQPGMIDPITLADPQGDFQVSPFVLFDDDTAGGG